MSDENILKFKINDPGRLYASRRTIIKTLIGASEEFAKRQQEKFKYSNEMTNMLRLAYQFGAVDTLKRTGYLGKDAE